MGAFLKVDKNIHILCALNDDMAVGAIMERYADPHDHFRGYLLGQGRAPRYVRP
jgi:hypothetical protein